METDMAAVNALFQLDFVKTDFIFLEGRYPGMR